MRDIPCTQQPSWNLLFWHLSSAEKVSSWTGFGFLLPFQPQGAAYQQHRIHTAWGTDSGNIRGTSLLPAVLDLSGGPVFESGLWQLMICSTEDGEEDGMAVGSSEGHQSAQWGVLCSILWKGTAASSPTHLHGLRDAFDLNLSAAKGSQGHLGTGRQLELQSQPFPGLEPQVNWGCFVSAMYSFGWWAPTPGLAWSSCYFPAYCTSALLLGDAGTATYSSI